MKLRPIAISNLLLIRFPVVIALFAVMVVISNGSIDSITQGMGLKLFNSARFEEATRAEMEMHDLLGKAYRFASGDAAVKESDVNLALDIFWSRVDVLKTASYQDALSSGGVMKTEIVPEIAAALPSLEKAVGALRFGEPDSYAGMAAFALRYQDALMAYSDKAYIARRNEMRHMTESGIKSLDDLKSLQFSYTALAVVTFLYVLFELFLSRRGNRKLNVVVEDKQRLLVTDQLTGIGNRRRFEAELQNLVGGDHAIVMLDLDGFKAINDTLGHAAGDHLLRHVASTLARLSGLNDVVCRLGGDEFAIVLHGSRERAGNFSERALLQVAAPLAFEGNLIKVSASIGIAHSSECGQAETGISLMKSADIALYAAKGAGRNCVRSATAEIMRDSIRRRRLQKELRLAIEEGQIELAFQPIVVLETGMPRGMETLVRWHHAEFGHVAPPEIIDAAEQTGQILPLTLYVLDRACQMRNDATLSGFDLQFTVNVTPGLLNISGFAGLVNDTIARHGIECGKLMLELTEDAMMGDSDAVDTNLAELRSFGIFLAVDDFGKGYSNLSRLASLEFRKVKLDKSLIDRVTTSERSRHIALGICRMASDLGMNVVAEGVETAEQRLVLKELGIPLAQGYFYARPMNRLALMSYLGQANFGSGRDLSLRVAS